MTEDESTLQEIAVKRAKLEKLEKVNADLREKLANLPTDPTEQLTLAPVSLSLTQPSETAPSPAQSTPTQQSNQKTQPTWQAQEFSSAPVSTPQQEGKLPMTTIPCPQCGELLPTQVLFCGRCGQALTQAPQNSARGASVTGSRDALPQETTSKTGRLQMARSARSGQLLLPDNNPAYLKGSVTPLFSDVFLSYSRKDKAFVRQLFQKLAAANRDTWVDWDDIPPTADWQQEIYMGIEAASAFVFVLSPDSLSSEACQEELKHALHNKKRIIPLLYREVERKNVYEGLVKLNWISFEHSELFDLAFQQLLFALDTDLDYWHQSARFLTGATEWEKKRKERSSTLRGRELKAAERWMAEGATKTPPPGPPVTDFIVASIKQRKRSRSITVTLMLVFLLIAGSAVYFYLQLPPDPTLVTTTNDSGTGSLRWSIANAPNGSTITFDQSVRGTIKLTSGELTIKGKLTIHGPGSEVLAVSSGKTNSAILISPGASVTISGLSFQDSSFTGRSFINNSGTLSLVNSTLSNNHVNVSGGAIDNNGTLSVRNSSILANSAFDQFFGGSSYQGGGRGGGIYNTGAGTVTVVNSTISGNSADIGGGIEGGQGTFTVMNSTISGNSAWQTGGGIDTAGPLTLINSTLANNTVGNSYTQNISGGGIYSWYHQTGPVPLLLAFDTIYGNTSSGTGGAIENNADILTIKDSIIAENNTSYGSDIAGQVPPTILGGRGLVTTGGYNLFQNVSGVSFADPNGLQNTDMVVNTSDLSNIFGSHPQLQANGGATKTYALLPISSNPAIGKIPLQYCHIPEILNKQSHQYIDQRGTPRPNGEEQLCDIGAYEAGAPPITQSQSTVTPYPTPTVGPIPLAGNLTEFATPTNVSGPEWITAGPDGNLWFTEPEIWANRIGRITPAGTVTEFSIPTSGSAPEGITAGPDGNLWFTEGSSSSANKIGRITPGGAITEFPIPTSGSVPTGITAGPDGNLWFTIASLSMDKIGRITPSGTVTVFPIPRSRSGPTGITAGPDGNLWFTEVFANKIGRITPGGTITEFPIPTPKSGLEGITAGPDGNLWFTEFWENKIGRITPAGAITEFAIPTSGSYPKGITAGPDGNLWFTESQGNQIGRITLTGTITEFRMNTPETYPFGITRGSDGNLWFTEQLGNKIGRIKIGQLM